MSDDTITPEELMELEATPLEKLVEQGIIESAELPSMLHILTFEKKDGKVTGKWVETEPMQE